MISCFQNIINAEVALISNFSNFSPKLACVFSIIVSFHSLILRISLYNRFIFIFVNSIVLGLTPTAHGLHSERLLINSRAISNPQELIFLFFINVS